MRGDTSAAGLLDAERGEVVRGEMLAFDHDVLDVRVSASNKLRNRIGECRSRVTVRNVVLDDSGLALVFNHDQIAGMGHGWRRAGSGYKQQVNGLLQRHAARDVDIRPIL